MLSYYTVTPLPPTQPTPQSVWRPHQPHRPLSPYPDIHNSKRSTARTTARTTTRTTSTTTTTTTPRPSEIFGSVEGDQSTAETAETEDYETGLWVDVPAEPESASSSPGLGRQVERLRAHYLKMGVPHNYLTDQMIWKLMQARGGQTEDAGFHF